MPVEECHPFGYLPAPAEKWAGPSVLSRFNAGAGSTQSRIRGMMITMLTWETVNGEAIYPNVRYRVDVGKREYRILLDPKGEHVKSPDPDAPEGEWWFLIGRETRLRPLDWYIALSAYRSVGAAKRAADDYERADPQ